MFVLGLMFQSLAERPGEERPVPRPWPETQLIPIRISHHSTSFDGIDLRVTSYHNDAVTFYSAITSQLARSKSLFHRSASMVLLNSKNHDLKIGISICKAEHWLGELTVDRLNEYVLSLRMQHGEEFSLIESTEGFRPQPHSPYFLDRAFRVVHYRIETEEQSIEIQDFIMEREGYLFVYSVEAPELLFSGHFENSKSIFRSLTVEEYR